MNTATLAFVIATAILAQVLGVALLGFYRQRGRYRALATGAARDFAPVPQRVVRRAPGAAAPPRTGQPPAPKAAPVLVRFSRSGKQAHWTPATGSLLDLAEAAGMVVAPGCRTGECGGCETAIASGAVAYAKPPAVRIAAGHGPLCIGTAKGDLTLTP